MFINIPNNFSSMWGELIYEFDNPDGTDIVIEIEDARKETTIAVKKFYSATSAKINITPIIFDLMLPAPIYMGEYGIEFSLSGFPMITLTANDISSDVRYFTYARQRVSSTPALLTTMPLNRLLYRGECDSAWFVGSAANSTNYEVWLKEIDGDEFTYYGGDVVALDDITTIYHMAANQFADEYREMQLRITCGTSYSTTINYTLYNEESSGYRLAWISSQGSIEHYTFPIIESRTRLSTGATSLTLRSAYGTQDQIEALSEIITSPKVWHADTSGYTEIELITSQITLEEGGVLAIATINIEENG